jgi:hypothetical protein
MIPGMIREAIPRVAKIDPICPPSKFRLLPKYPPREINHVPQMKNWRKLITMRRFLIPIISSLN